ncbi:MAG: sulfite exporter TauE/SafE family protein [Alphaproteobacteria bacterium]|nr:MAG: sulfite exporter TauE/SafE family protein [Alphaproteobacteria bacterium]
MGDLAAIHGWPALVAAFALMGLAGFVKGAVGFALPMIAVSAIGSILPAPLAVAAVILPSLASNLWQALRQGLGEAWGSLRRFLWLNAVLVATIWASAQLVAVLSDRALFLILGVGVTGFSALQLSGWRPPDPGPDRRVEAATGVVAGFFGGLSGVWGPPIVLYLLARQVPKVEMVRVQGISYLAGSVTLTAAHGGTGLLGGAAAWLSAAMVVPALAGMWVGLRLQDRMPQARFRRVTMVVLVLAGLNLLRRGLAG